MGLYGGVSYGVTSRLREMGVRIALGARSTTIGSMVMRRSLSLVAVGLVVGAFVKIFRFQATNPDNPPRAGVSTKPLDGTLLELQLRDDYVTADHGETE